MKVPFHRPFIGEEEIQAVTEVLRSGWLTSGKKAVEFEKEFSSFKNGSEAIAVNSCTSALFLILKALGIKEGDEVITTAITFAATANVVIHCGAKPVFADIDPSTGNIDPKEIEKKINLSTKAVIAVHLGGNLCDMDALLALCKEYNLFLIEDCAHCIEGGYKGNPSGTMGIASAFSFYPTKNITTGEGGLVLTKDKELAKKIRLLRMHGMNKSLFERSVAGLEPLYDILIPGYKFNMSDINAALGIVQMKRMDEFSKKRKEIAEKFTRELSKISQIRIPSVQTSSVHPFHLFMILTERRNELMAFLKNEKGIETSVNYLPLHKMTYYKENFPGVSLPHAEKWGNETLSLPIFPGMTDDEVDYVVGSIREFYS